MYKPGGIKVFFFIISRPVSILGNSFTLNVEPSYPTFNRETRYYWIITSVYIFSLDIRLVKASIAQLD